MKKSIVKNHFTAFANDWIKSSYEGGGYEYPTARHRLNVVRDILADINAPARITDLGCGGGHLAVHLAEAGHEVTGIDQSEEMIRISQSIAADRASHLKGTATFRQAELEELTVPQHDQDAVTSMGVIGYLAYDAPIFHAADALLKPGGRFVVSCRNRLFNMTSISYRTRREFEGGDAGRLLDEIVSHTSTIPAERMRELAEGLIAAGGEILKALDQPADDASPLDELQNAVPSIEARQHTPDGIRTEAQKHGFEMVGLHGVHPHLMQPHLAQKMPPFTFNILSATLESLHDLPASVGWSSVFIAVFRKAD